MVTCRMIATVQFFCLPFFFRVMSFQLMNKTQFDELPVETSFSYESTFFYDDEPKIIKTE